MDRYYLSREVSLSFDETLLKVQDLLKQEGFGILTEIDVQATLKKKLDVEFARYLILGACNPHYAHRALQAEPYVGVLLPCNVIVREKDSGQVEVAAMDPSIVMEGAAHPELLHLAGEVRASLSAVFERL